MKMVKKILFGAVALAAVLSLASCGMKDDDEGAITGAGNTYKVKYENSDKDNNYRAYKSTTFKHAGALVKVTFNKTDIGASKMGVIFGLTENKSADGKSKTRDFYIIGLGTLDKSNFYVSKYTNIADIQAENFGATTTAKDTEPKEVELVKLSDANSITLPAKADDGSISVYIWYQAQLDGSYKWAVLSLTDDQVKLWDKATGAIPAGATTIREGTIKDAFTAVTDAKDLPQYPISVYSMIKPAQSVDGQWKIVGTYKEAEDAE